MFSLAPCALCYLLGFVCSVFIFFWRGGDVRISVSFNNCLSPLMDRMGCSWPPAVADLFAYVLLISISLFLSIVAFPYHLHRAVLLILMSVTNYRNLNWSCRKNYLCYLSLLFYEKWIYDVSDGTKSTVALARVGTGVCG